jgi:hypothetical protein
MQNQNKTNTARIQSDPRNEIVRKIQGSESILIAVNADPTIDELVSAIAMTLAFTRLSKHATSIFSGNIPEQIEFLQPEKTFEIDTNSLQDFIVSLNKDKADHLRIKNDGNFVRVYITPYRTTITPEDLTFSHGDYNIDLIIALNVSVVGNLDKALSEHGRIMHNASVVNISSGEPGRFGDIIWAVPGASSMAELTAMVLDGLRNNFADGELVDQAIATAILTGLVSATDRFSNAKTTPVVMNLASRLMSLGADQAEISGNLVGAPTPPAAPVSAPNATPLMDANEMPVGVTALPVIEEVAAAPSTIPTDTPAPQPATSAFLTPNADILTEAKTIQPLPAAPAPAASGIAPELADLARPGEQFSAPTPTPVTPSSPAPIPAPMPEPTPAPTVAPPAPAPQPVPGTPPTVQEIQHMLDEGLPLPPEFDPRLSAPTLEKPVEANAFQLPVIGA